MVRAPTQTLTTALRRMPSGGSGNFGSSTAKAAQWYTYATSVSENEDLPRFVFAIAGIEVLIRQTQKAVRGKLLKVLGELAPDAPVKDLLWPEKGDAWVERNLLANFAGLATIYSPESASLDTEIFRSLVQTERTTSRLRESDVRNQGIACRELLRRYLRSRGWHIGVGSCPGQARFLSLAASGITGQTRLSWRRLPSLQIPQERLACARQSQVSHAQREPD